MPYYAQKNYNQELGNGTYTIAQAGCLLTSICNLLMRFGVTMDPPALDNYYKTHSDFAKDSDGSYEDLAWNSISLVDPLVVVTNTGTSAVPPDPKAIVKFHFQSIETPTVIVDGREVPNMVDHFCAVDRISNGQVFIIDSWDGLIKSPSTYQSSYGKPIAWATYEKKAPVAVADVKAPAAKLPSAPITAPPKITYKVIKPIPGYYTANQAVNHSGNTVTVSAGLYYTFNTDYGMKNVNKEYGRPGSWINPADNTYTPVPQSSPPTTLKPETYTVKRTLDGYKTSDEAANHLDSTATVQPGVYYVYNTEHGMINLTDMLMMPGSWINPTDNVPPTNRPATGTPVPTHAATDKTTVTETEQATAPSWRASYKPFPMQPTMYYAMQTFTIHDLATTMPDTICNKYEECPLAGTFVGPDGVLYGRSMKSTFPNLRSTTAAQALPPYYYGLPMKYLMLEDELYSTETDTATRQFTGTMTLRDHLVVLIGKFSGWLDRLGKKQPADYDE